MTEWDDREGWVEWVNSGAIYQMGNVKEENLDDDEFEVLVK